MNETFDYSPKVDQAIDDINRLGLLVDGQKAEAGLLVLAIMDQWDYSLEDQRKVAAVLGVEPIEPRKE